jgi:hypothetical protein
MMFIELANGKTTYEFDLLMYRATIFELFYLVIAVLLRGPLPSRQIFFIAHIVIVMESSEFRRKAGTLTLVGQRRCNVLNQNRFFVAVIEFEICVLSFLVTTSRAQKPTHFIIIN